MASTASAIRLRPSPDKVAAAKHKEIARHYDRKRKDSASALPLVRIAKARVHDLGRFFPDKYGLGPEDGRWIFPDYDDDALEDLIIACHAIALLHIWGGVDPTNHVIGYLAARAPWMSPEECDRLTAKVIRSPRMYRADTLGRKIGLTWAKRVELGITTIRAIDQTPELVREHKAARNRARVAKYRARKRVEARPKPKLTEAERKERRRERDRLRQAAARERRRETRHAETCNAVFILPLIGALQSLRDAALRKAVPFTGDVRAVRPQAAAKRRARGKPLAASPASASAASIRRRPEVGGAVARPLPGADAPLCVKTRIMFGKPRTKQACSANRVWNTAVAGTAFGPPLTAMQAWDLACINALACQRWALAGRA
jgi:hypothetical protein